MPLYFILLQPTNAQELQATTAAPLYTTFSWVKGMTFAEEPIAEAANEAAAAAALGTTPAPTTSTSLTAHTAAPTTVATTTTKKQGSNVCMDKSRYQKPTKFPPTDMAYTCKKMLESNHVCIKGSKYKDFRNASVLRPWPCEPSDGYYKEYHPDKKDYKEFPIKKYHSDKLQWNYDCTNFTCCEPLTCGADWNDLCDDLEILQPHNECGEECTRKSCCIKPWLRPDAATTSLPPDTDPMLHRGLRTSTIVPAVPATPVPAAVPVPTADPFDEFLENGQPTTTAVTKPLPCQSHVGYPRGATNDHGGYPPFTHSRDRKSCPLGYDPIFTVVDCHAAARYMDFDSEAKDKWQSTLHGAVGVTGPRDGLAWVQVDVVKEDDPAGCNMPPGCLWSTRAKSVHLNLNMEGSPEHKMGNNAVPLCKRACIAPDSVNKLYDAAVEGQHLHQASVIMGRPFAITCGAFIMLVLTFALVSVKRQGFLARSPYMVASDDPDIKADTMEDGTFTLLSREQMLQAPMENTP
jgi:hypothetical protein